MALGCVEVRLDQIGVRDSAKCQFAAAAEILLRDPDGKRHNLKGPTACMASELGHLD
jgi:hypothetical protein